MASNPSQAGLTWKPAELYTAWVALGTHISDAADAATLNAQTYVAGPFDITWSSVRDVLMGGGAAEALDWGKLTQVANTAVGGINPGGGTQTAAIQAVAIAIQECCLYGGILRGSDTNIWALITAAGTTLSAAAVGGLSAASATAVVALRAPTVAVWNPVITANDITTVRTTQP